MAMRLCWKKQFPFNKNQVKILVALFTCMFSSAFSITILFPFLPFMVQFLLPSIEPASVGTYAGMIASSMFAGRFFGSYVWGLLADSWGKKRVIVLSELLLGLSSLVFGFSINIYMAVITRFLVGLSNGIIGTAKASVSESCTDKTQPFALGILTGAFGVGLVIGPAVSGAIADPITQYNLTVTSAAFNSFLTKFPYSLPCIVNFFLCLLGMILALTLLSGKSESSPRIQSGNSASIVLDENAATVSLEKNSSVDSGLDEQEDEQVETDYEEKQELEVGETTNEDEQCLVVEEKDSRRKNRKSSYVLSIIPGRRNSASLQYIKIPRSKALSEHVLREEKKRESVEEEMEKEQNKSQPGKRSLIKRMFYGFKKGVIKGLKDLKIFAKDSTTRLVLLIYCSFSFVVIGFDELYSLWCSTSSDSGGLNFTLHDIGISLTVIGLLLLPFSFIIFPILEKCFGSIKSFQFCATIQLFFVLLFPSIHFLLLIKKPAVVWVVLCGVGLVVRAVTTVGFSATTLFINNSVTFDKLGSLNGLAISLTSLFRTFSPLFVGAIYSASLSESLQSKGFPIDYHLIFIILSFILLIVVLMSTRLPLTINKQKMIEETPL